MIAALKLPCHITRAAVLAAAALLATSCAASVNTGPLGKGGTSGGICQPVRPGNVVSWGQTDLFNTGSSDAIIESVSLVQPQHVRLIAAYVVPITGLLDYGDWNGPPQRVPHQAGVQWARHTRARGAHVPPRHGLPHADLVAVLKPTARVAKALALRVRYREAGTQYVMQTNFRLVFLWDGPNACPSNWPRKYPG